MMALKDVAVSSGSACTSAVIETSYVLRALGVPEEAAESTIRLGLGRFTSVVEVDLTAEKIQKSVRLLRQYQ